MKTGLLWFDDDPNRTLEDKVLKATAHYEHKYGQPPNLCLVHPGTFSGNGKRPVSKAGGVEIRPGRSVLPHHFWLGVADDDGGKSKRSPERGLVAHAEETATPVTAERVRQAVTELGTVQPGEERALGEYDPQQEVLTAPLLQTGTTQGWEAPKWTLPSS